MRVTVLSENTSAKSDICCEHGLSLFIETGSRVLLFDTGQGGLFAENAAKLGVDLSSVDIAVLSHGHYDHGGGLPRFLELNDTAPVYLSRYAFEPHYNAKGSYIGLPQELRESGRLVYTDGIYKIADGITLYDCNGSHKPYGSFPTDLTAELGGRIVPDDFRHEQYLLIEEAGKRVLISGCSHKGVLNIAEWFRPDVMIGGFHLMKTVDEDTLVSCAEKLDGYMTEFYTCHCTGVEQYEVMKPHMKRLRYLSCGVTVTI